MATADVDPDSEWFTRLRGETVDRVTAYARSRVPADQAADVVAQTYLVAWRRRTDIPERALPWLLVIARNTISEHRRSAARNTVLVAGVERLHHLFADAGPDVAAEVVERISVLAAVDSLNAADREVLLLTVWDRLSARDAARVAGCSTATFAVRLHRARTRLRHAMAAQDAGADQPAQPPPARTRPDAPTRRQPTEESP